MQTIKVQVPQASELTNTQAFPKLRKQCCHERASQTEIRGQWAPIESSEVAVQTIMQKCINSDDDATDFFPT